MSPIDILPDEILMHIFSYVVLGNNRASVRLTNQQFKNLLDQTLRDCWKNLKDNPPS